MEKVMVLIEVSKKRYDGIKYNVENDKWSLLSFFERKVAAGQLLPNDCEILTREAYSDLCTRAAMMEDDGK